MEQNSTVLLNDKGEFITTSMPAIYFDHDSSDFGQALGLTETRKEELKENVKGLFDKHKELNIPFKKTSEKLEAVLKLATNTQERIFLSFTLGAMAARSQQPHIHSIEMVSPEDVPDEIKAEIKKFVKHMRKKFDRPDPENED